MQREVNKGASRVLEHSTRQSPVSQYEQRTSQRGASSLLDDDLAVYLCPLTGAEEVSSWDAEVLEVLR